MPKIAASERDAFYEARRTELIDGALRLWAERGFDATSVASLAAEAGIAKGTFYLYFESKQALLGEVFRRNSLVPLVDELVADLQKESLEEAVGAFVRSAWRHLSSRRELLMVALRELPSHLAEAGWIVEKILVPTNKLIEASLEQRVGDERARELNLIVSGRGLIGMVLFVFITQEVLGAKNAFPVAEEEIMSTLAELFLRGVQGSSEVSAGEGSA